ncbi:D-alanyl-D-alanine carboxypeptidase family protein [Paenibacillus filicis]|uniref:serine-type D-Ala-D-Ala carboxypeptidase n=1 Tax=Paenibacillus filicis TaxID=669464 RepID=A0ABU9DPM0_9BACL
MNIEFRTPSKWTSFASRKHVAAVLLAFCFMTVPLSAPAQTAATAAAGPSTIAAATTSQAAVLPPVSSLQLNLKAAVLLEPDTGEVFLSVNADKALAPASMTKMMTLYIVQDKIKKGDISWEDPVTITENASKTLGSLAFLPQGKKPTVKELYISMVLRSSNGSAVALAEYISGSEQHFVQWMNQEAGRMGMLHTNYINASGLDRSDMPRAYRPESTAENMMSALDAATLVKHIIRDHPEYAEVSTLPSYTFRESDKLAIENSNWMLESNKTSTRYKQFAYEGLDGMKTGFTDNAGYCFAGTAERDGLRLISVVMGTDSPEKRFTETKKVLDYGFDHLEIKQVIARHSAVQGEESLPVKLGQATEVPVALDAAVDFLVPKGSDPAGLAWKTEVNAVELTAPVEAGTKAGTVTYTYQIQGMDKLQKKTVHLITTEKVEKASWFTLMVRSVREFFSQLF